METVLVAVDPELVGRQLKIEDDPLGRIARLLPGIKLVFIRSAALAEHLATLGGPAALTYYRDRTEEVLPARVNPDDFPDRLSAMLAGAAEAAGASFVLTDNQELTHLPYPGGRFVDEWDLADALGPGETPEALVAGQKTESVFKCADEIQCNMLVGLLEGEAIPCLVKSQEVTSLDGLLATGAGFWADLHVFVGDADRARRLIGEYLAARTQE
ncbi:MAG: hypothetical protein A2Y64_02975 [Candidatus Coatesbacteria bacterium RBG_13_66_14]|uniref:Uncharacterized protein n=1 Tax=Candidatus Coatesbacteria bacterium RBG_13_66_14 TaxID=1817816 RepID=A0A1F5FGX9_9BACT|nr:MAG: hypothetical protein A2Y64_02975 [Candidatus Coatesbacteria bacterium RBG_13_66_14]